MLGRLIHNPLPQTRMFFLPGTLVTPLPPLKLGTHGHEITDTSRVILTHAITHSVIMLQFLCISLSHLCGKVPGLCTREAGSILIFQPTVVSSLNREVGAQGATQSCLLLSDATVVKCPLPDVIPCVLRRSFHIPDSPSARNSSVNKDSQNALFSMLR